MSIKQSPEFRSPDTYATAIVGGLVNGHSFGRRDAIKLVNGNEKVVRAAHQAQVRPGFVAGRLAKSAMQQRSHAIAKIASRKPTGRSGLSTGSTQACEDGWIPPAYVAPRVSNALEEGLGEFLHFGTAKDGMVFGRSAKMPLRLSPGVTRSKSGSSWTRGGALYVSSSKNSKIGDLDATWVAIAQTCVDCKLKDEGTCYAKAGYRSGKVVTRLEKAAGKESAEEVALDEAACIDSAYDGGMVPGHRVLRIHASGDTSTKGGAAAIGAAVTNWRRRGGKHAYTYTHSWGRVPRSTWGKDVSVMASVDSPSDVSAALKNGYHSATIVQVEDEWAKNWAFTRNGLFVFKAFTIPQTHTDMKWIPCPAQYPHDKDEKENGTLKPGEAFRWKKLLVAELIGLPAVKAGKMTVEQLAVEVARAYEHKPTAAALAHRNVPNPATHPSEFAQAFRLIAKGETATCETCELCFYDSVRGQKRQSIMFRPDKSGGVAKTEEAIKSRVQEKIHLSVVK